MSLLEKLNRPINKKKKGQTDLTEHPGVDPSAEELINPFTGQPVAGGDSTSSQSTSKPRDLLGSLGLDPELSAAASLKLKKSFNLAQLSEIIETSESVLVFESGAFGLRAAIIRDQKKAASITAVAQSSIVDFTRAIGDVLAQLKQHQKRLPRKAVLITPSVVTALIPLPVSPLRPRPPEEMAEMIRWEMEATVASQNQQWQLGAILVARHHLTAEQRDLILDELSLRKAQSSQNMARFGDVAMELGYIDEEQLDACIRLQEKLVSMDDELDFSWQASESSQDGPSDEVLLSMEDDRDRNYPWLVSAINQIVQQRWIGAFYLNKIKLEAFYPCIGSGFAALDLQSSLPEQLILEIHPEHLAAIHGEMNFIREHKVSPRPSGLLTADHCLNLLSPIAPEIQQIYISGEDADQLHFLIEDLSLATGLPVENLSLQESLPELPDGIKPHDLIGLSGIANYHLRHVAAPRICRLLPPKPKESNLQKLFKPQNLTMAASIVGGIGLVGLLVWMHDSANAQKQRLDDLNAEYDSQMRVKQQMESIYQLSLAIGQQIEDTRKEIAATDALLAEVDANVTYRASALNAILKAIAIGISPEVAITTIEKKADKLTVNASAYSNAAGMSYVDNLTQLLKPVNYEITNTALTTHEDEAQGFSLVIDLDYQPKLAHELFATLLEARAKNLQAAAEAESANTTLEPQTSRASGNARKTSTAKSVARP